ncbi:MAG: hypothetical protein SA339_09340 [Methanomassiliicoccus sp.]|nr:hypothetical protein [Methanomassiliicoccus sp.]
MNVDNKRSMLSLTMGSGFLALGVLELAAIFAHEGWLTYASANGNVMLGLALLLVGATFFAALKRSRNGADGDAFLIVGCMLGLFIGLVALLTLMADASEAFLLANEEFVGWVPWDDFTPAIPMMVPCLAVLWHELKAFGAVKPRSQVTGRKE